MLHKLEEDCRSLLDAKFPEYFHFRHNHLDLLIGADKHWRLDTLENLELIGMASFGVVKSLNYINHNIEKIQRSDRDQRFKNIYFHFGLVFDCVNNLARNIALTSDYLGLKKINREPKGDEELVKKFKKWVSKEYSKKLASSIQNGGAVVFIPHQIDFLHGLVSSKPLMTEHSNFAKSVNKYRNFFIHQAGVDVIQRSKSLFVVKREKVQEARSWSKLRTTIAKDHKEMFVNPKEQANDDLDKLLIFLGRLWREFDMKMTEIQGHAGFNSILHGFKRP